MACKASPQVGHTISCDTSDMIESSDPQQSSSADATQARGIVAFSFGKRPEAEEPNPSNRVLAETVVRVARTSPRDVVVAQWEVARGVTEGGTHIDVTVNPPADGSYLSTDDVWAVARERFRRDGIEVVTPVAHPFLHLGMTKRMIEADGFRVASADMPSVPFDNSDHNTQWWTKGRVRLIAYSVARVVRARV